MSKGKALAISAITVMVATLLGRIFGFAREVAIANKFGASAETDAFLVAFAIPNVIYSLVVMGALSASFIPVFTGLLANDKEKEAWRLANTILNLLLIAFGLMTTVLVVFAPQVILLAAPGFGTSGQSELAVNLLRVMAPAMVFMGISGLMAGILNSYNHFAAPSSVALVQNIIVVASIFAFADRIGIYGAALGFLLSSVGQVLIQLPFVMKRRLPYQLIIDLKSKDIINVGKLFVPVLIALSASQSNTIIDKLLASYLADGSISYLNYAYKVGSLPLNTLIAAVAIVLFPTLSRQAATEDVEALKNTVSAGIRIIALVAIPASVGLFVLSSPITRLLFEHGAFSRSATLATAPTLAAYSFGLLAMGLNMLAIRVFYALKDGMTPLKASVAFAVALVGLDLFLMGFLSHIGLAVGYVLAMSLMALILFWSLRKRFNGLGEAQILRSFVKIVTAAIIMGVVIRYVSDFAVIMFPGESKLNDLVTVSASILAGIAAYTLALVIARADEVSMILGMVKSKISRSRPQVVQ